VLDAHAIAAARERESLRASPELRRLALAIAEAVEALEARADGR